MPHTMQRSGTRPQAQTLPAGRPSGKLPRMSRPQDTPDVVVNSVAPIRICDNGCWTDTWFAGHGAVFNLAVSPLAEVQILARRIDAGPRRIVLHAEDYGPPYLLPHEGPPWGAHPLLEAAVVSIQVPQDLSLDVTIHSDAPAGAGTGTSAAVTVALVAALDALTPGRLTKHEVAVAAHRVETEMLGRQCGIQDQLASAYGGISYIEMSEYPTASVSPVHVGEDLWWELERRLLLVFLGRSHDSSSIHETVIRSLESEGPEAPALEALRRMAPMSRAALVAGDFAGLGRAMVASTEAQADLHPALVGTDARTVIDIARAHGALGWKVNGAGGEGGSLSVLCDGRAARKRALVRENRARVGGVSPHPRRARPARRQGVAYGTQSDAARPDRVRALGNRGRESFSVCLPPEVTPDPYSRDEPESCHRPGAQPVVNPSTTRTCPPRSHTGKLRALQLCAFPFTEAAPCPGAAMSRRAAFVPWFALVTVAVLAAGRVEVGSARGPRPLPEVAPGQAQGASAALPSETPAKLEPVTRSFAYDKRNVMIPMRDGVKLHTIVIVPRRAKGAPILLTRTPYNAAALTSHAKSAHLGPILQGYDNATDVIVGGGYIRVVQDVRGKYGSEGDYVMNRPLRGPLNPTPVDHATDAYDTIDWLVKNVPESNGRVGVLGISYDGFLTLMAMVDPHPALKVAVPMNPMVDGWLGDDWFHNGAFRQQMMPYVYDQAGTRASDVNWWTSHFDDYDMFMQAGSAGELGRQRGLEQVGFWRKLVDHPAYDAFWQEQAVDRLLAARPLGVPTMIVHGLWDQEDIYGAPAVYRVLEPKDTANDKVFLVMGPWHHGQQIADGSALGALRFGSDTALTFRREILGPFLDQYLRDGAPVAGIAPVSAFETGTNTWRRLASWPAGCPSGCAIEPQALYLKQGLGLAFSAPAPGDAAYRRVRLGPGEAGAVPVASHAAGGIRGRTDLAPVAGGRPA